MKGPIREKVPRKVGQVPSKGRSTPTSPARHRATTKLTSHRDSDSAAHQQQLRPSEERG